MHNFKSDTIFNLQDAFSRNKGLISESEQICLYNKTVAIPGCGGVGGFHALTLARLGIGGFRIADPDEFSVGNFNRQIGANMDTIDRNKARVIAEMIKKINPDASVDVLEEGVNQENIGDFVFGSDLVVDGVDFFSLDARRMLFAAARERSIPAMTAAPLGFSGALLIFSPGGMSFDEYFDINNSQSYYEQIINFLIGLAPSALHIKYMDLSGVDPKTGRGPSSVIGVQLAASLVGAEAVRLLLNKGDSLLAPNYFQFDAYRRQMRKKRLPMGNRSPLQKLKRQLVVKKFKQIGLDKAFAELMHE